MTQLVSYLTFSGNCREAMTFYRNCLGGELHFQALKDSPKTSDMPNLMKECIVHAVLSKENLVLMGSDLGSDAPRVQGNSFSLLLQCQSEDELRNYYLRLSEGAQEQHGIAENYFGVLFGDLIDKYGTHWIFSHIKNNH